MKTLNAPAHTPTNGTHALWNQSQKRKISCEKKIKYQAQDTTFMMRCASLKRSFRNYKADME